jgi:hypothetical protein
LGEALNVRVIEMSGARSVIGVILPGS